MNSVDDELSALRVVFDEVDDAIIALLAQRQRLAEHAGRLKRIDGRQVKDEAREASASARRADKAVAVGVDADVVADVFEVIVRASRDRQEATRTR